MFSSFIYLPNPGNNRETMAKQQDSMLGHTVACAQWVSIVPISYHRHWFTTRAQRTREVSRHRETLRVCRTETLVLLPRKSLSSHLYTIKIPSHDQFVFLLCEPWENPLPRHAQIAAEKCDLVIATVDSSNAPSVQHSTSICMGRTKHIRAKIETRDLLQNTPIQM